MLKKRLEGDEAWSGFGTQVGQTKCQTQQTELAFLVPPSQRSKARYMNVEPLVRWGRETLRSSSPRPPKSLRTARCHGSRRNSAGCESSART